MAELAIRKITILVYLRNNYRMGDRLQTQSGRFEMGAEALLRINVFPSFLRFIERERNLTQGEEFLQAEIEQITNYHNSKITKKVFTGATKISYINIC